MTGSATITFSQAGTRPPVYVVTSLSNPPWETLEMDVTESPTTPSDFVFTKQFKDVAQGRHQYKIRLGSDWWIVDESQESATDEHGNRNNVVHVKPEPIVSAPIAAQSKGTIDALQDETFASSLGKRKDSSMDTTQLAEVPLVVVEKSDDRPVLGEDFGEHATVTQKSAHDVRAADALPDKVIVSSDHDAASQVEDKQEAPLFRHESLQTNDHPPISLADTAEEASIQSSDYTSSSDIIATPSEHASQEDIDPHQAPAFTHETGSTGHKGELDNGPLLPHETGLEGKHADVANGGPLSSHSDDESDGLSDGETEFDRAPLLPHETGFSGHTGTENLTNGNIHTEGQHQHLGPYDDDESDEGDLQTGHLDNEPLLPHERDSAIGSNNGSELSSEDAHYISHGGGMGPRIFRTGSGSTLPHNLPRSDAEDENLHDPSLEQFPTSREQIFERVKTIGLSLPEDHPIEDHPHSPQLSVLSQACSSVDLVPTRSYTSLASVPEADNSDDDNEDEDNDVPSPLFIAAVRPQENGHETQPTATLEQSKSTELNESNVQALNKQSEESFETGSISKTDGADETPNLSTPALAKPIATPRNILDPVPMIISLEEEQKDNLAREASQPTSEPDSQLRQRREPANDSSKATEDSKQPAPQEDISTPTKDKSSAVQGHMTQSQSDSFIKSLLVTLFGPLARFLKFCLGVDRKNRAR